MRCPTCGGDRVALAAPAGEQPGVYRVCLGCAAFWEPQDDEGAAAR